MTNPFTIHSWGGQEPIGESLCSSSTYLQIVVRPDSVCASGETVTSGGLPVLIGFTKEGMYGSGYSEELNLSLRVPKYHTEAASWFDGVDLIMDSNHEVVVLIQRLGFLSGNVIKEGGVFNARLRMYDSILLF